MDKRGGLKMSDKFFSLIESLRASDNPQFKGLLFYELSIRFAFLSLIFFILSIIFFNFTRAIFFAELLAFTGMLISEVLGRKRMLFPLRKSARIISKILVVPVIAIVFFFFGMPFGMPDQTPSDWPFFMAGLSVVTLNILIHVTRTPLENGAKPL